MRLRWTPAARGDLLQILEFIAADSVDSALATVERIEAAARRLTEYPQLGRLGPAHDTRSLPVPGLPFLIVYRIRDESVEVFRIFHGARRWPLE